MKAIDLDTGSRDLLAPVCSTCLWWQTDNGAVQAPGARLEWERAAEAEAGFFGKALVEGDAVLGWMHVVPAPLAPHARKVPTGPPSGDAWVLTCSYFYDDEFLRGFQFLLQEVEASLKHRRVTALEAFALRHARADDRFRGYLRELNLFNPGVLEGSGFRAVKTRGDVARYRLDLRTLIAVPRRSRAWEPIEAGAAAQPI